QATQLREPEAPGVLTEGTPTEGMEGLGKLKLGSLMLGTEGKGTLLTFDRTESFQKRSDGRYSPTRPATFSAKDAPSGPDEIFSARDRKRVRSSRTWRQAGEF